MKFKFDNTYIKLPGEFYQKTSPGKVKNPKLILFNKKLANNFLNIKSDLNFDENYKYSSNVTYNLNTDAESLDLALLFSGNEIFEGSEPLAQAYAGHQFGHFVPQLGDGRAVLIGEILDLNNKRYDLVLKGSGRTPYSRGGDGRAPLGPMIREYVVSEAMHSLGVPTTRAMALVTTGEPVFREQTLPGAILTRVSKSHIRVGTFEYFASRGDFKNLKILADYSIQRHFPELIHQLKNEDQNSNQDNGQIYLEFLKSVIDVQAKLIAKWMSLGFIHGVMNTDNMTISGETIDYGPCAFMDYYHSEKVYSSIDQNGRYAYSNQPKIAEWNLSVLASCLLPLISGFNMESEKTNFKYSVTEIQKVQNEVDSFNSIYKKYDLKNMQEKLGLKTRTENDELLIQSFLNILQDQNIDFTLGFRYLSDVLIQDLNSTRFYKLFNPNLPIQNWISKWKERLALENNSFVDIHKSMNFCNPIFIPRNHQLAKVIEAAEINQNLEPLFELLDILSSPYKDSDSKSESFSYPPKAEDVVHKTFCGT